MSAPSLAPLSAEARARSEALTQRIAAAIDANGGGISFARFMDLALYTPELGYYSGAAQKFGAGGDFVTAPELAPVFGHCLANACAEILERVGGGDVLEAGAGSGALAAQLLTELERRDRLPQRYFILELSATLRAHQAQTLLTRAPHLAARVHWLDTLPAPGFRGVVLGNELLDAMPCEIFRVRADDIAQRQVTWRDGAFAWHEAPANADIVGRIAPLQLPFGYTSEINFCAEAWVRSVAERLGCGVVLLIDYGFPRAEFYHPQRAHGTLMCHYRHRAHGDPLIFVGAQDITAHVDFTSIADAGVSAGLDLVGYTSQAAFLLASGLAEAGAQSNPNDARAHLTLTQQIKKLTSPEEMGELFKVIALARGVPGSLSGFALQDRRQRLG